MERNLPTPESSQKLLRRGAALGVLTLSLTSCTYDAEAGTSPQEVYCGSEQAVSLNEAEQTICAVDDVDGMVAMLRENPTVDTVEFFITDDRIVDEVIRHNSDYRYAESSQFVEAELQLEARTNMEMSAVSLDEKTIDNEGAVTVTLYSR